MRAAPLPRSRITVAACFSVSRALGSRSALSKSNSTSAASSMRICVSVSVISRSCNLPPRFSTWNTRSVVRPWAPAGEVAGCAQATMAHDKHAVVAARRKAEPTLVLTRLLADGYIVEGHEMRNQDTDLPDVSGGFRKFRPQGRLRFRVDVLDVVAADTILVGIPNDKVFLLSHRIDQGNRPQVADVLILITLVIAEIPAGQLELVRGFIDQVEAQRQRVATAALEIDDSDVHP